MKNRLSRFLLGLLCLAAFCFSARAQTGNKITAMVTITNATTDGLTFTLNGDTRTFKTTPLNPATQVLISADVTGNTSKTNLLTQIRSAAFSQVKPVDTGSNSFNLVGNADLAMALSVSGTYASISYSTQLVTDMVLAQLPVSGLPTAQARTNVANGIVGAINAPENTNSIPQGSKAASELVGTNNNQTISGGKNFNNPASLFAGIVSNSPSISGTLGTVAGGTITGANFVGGAITGLPSIYLSNNAASETSSFFTHYDNQNNDSFMIGHGGGEFFLGIVETNGTGIAGGQSKSYIDLNLNGESEYNIIGGSGAHRFYMTPNNGIATNYFEITTSGVRAPIVTAPFIGNGGGLSNLNAGVLTNTIPPGPLSGANITNLTAQGMAAFPANSDIAFVQKSITTLANGANADLAIGTNVVIVVSGPTGAFSIVGIAGGRDGKIIIIKNKTGNTMTIVNQSGLETTAANRIRTGESGDFSNNSNPGIVTFEYDGADSRWDLVSFNNF